MFKKLHTDPRLPDMYIYIRIRTSMKVGGRPLRRRLQEIPKRRTTKRNNDFRNRSDSSASSQLTGGPIQRRRHQQAPTRRQQQMSVKFIGRGATGETVILIIFPSRGSTSSLHYCPQQKQEMQPSMNEWTRLGRRAGTCLRRSGNQDEAFP